MVQGPHFENHWSWVLSLEQTFSFEQILNFGVFRSIYSHFMDEGTGAHE